MKRSLKPSKSTDLSGGKKGKTSSVVPEKRFHYRSFNDRIEEISISSIQKIGGYRGSGPNSTDTTWFELSLIEWQELNCTAAFAKFAKIVRPLTGTLATVLFNRDAIMAAVFDVLRDAAANPEGPSRLALVPVLCLTAMLAKDLGPEFVPFFAEYFALLTPILPSSADAEVIEAAFASLLYTFKCILPHLLSDLPATFDSILKPLHACVGDNQKRQSVHLRKFTAQCCGYLLRKSSQLRTSGFFEYVQNGCKTLSWLPEFVADTLVSAILEEENGKLKNCLKPLYLESLAYLKEATTMDADDDCWISILRFTTVKLLDSADVSTNLPLWRIFVQLLEEDKDGETGVFSVPILIDAFALRAGRRVQLHRELLSNISKLKSVECVAYLLRTLTLELTLQNRPLVMKTCELICAGETERFLELVKFLAAFKWPHFEVVLKDQMNAALTSASNEDFIALVECVLEWQGSGCSVLRKHVPRLASIAETSDRALNLLVTNFVTFVPEKLKQTLSAELEQMIRTRSFDRSRLQIACMIQPVVTVDFTCLQSFIASPTTCEQLDACRIALADVSLSDDECVALVRLVMPVLRSHSQDWRLSALNLLQCLFKDQQSQEILGILQDVELVPTDLQNYRDKLVQLRRLDTSSLFKEPVSLLASVVMNYLFGFMQIRLTLLYPEGIRVMARFASAYQQEFSETLTQIFDFLPLGAHNGSSQRSNSEDDEDGVFYDIEVEDVSLLKIVSIRAKVHSNAKDASIGNESSGPALFENSLMFPALMRLLSAQAEVCLPQKSTFLREKFIPGVLDAFLEAPKDVLLAALLQQSASTLLKVFSGARIDDPRLDPIVLRFLAHGDLDVQTRALDCIFACPRLAAAISSAWKERLRAMLDEKLFRDEMTALTAEHETLHTVPNWIGSVAPFLVRILFGRLIARKGVPSTRLLARRRMIMGLFGTWDEESLAVVVDFLLEPFAAGIASVSDSKKLGFLNLCEEIFDNLGRKLDARSVSRLIETIFTIIESSTGADDDDEISTDSDDTKRIKQLGMKRIAQLFKLYEEEVFIRFNGQLTRLFDGLLNPRIVHLATQYTNSGTSFLMDIIVCLGQLPSADLLRTLIQLSPALWTNVIEAFAKESTKVTVLAHLTSFIEGVLSSSSRRKDAEFAEIKRVVVLPQLNALLDAFDNKLANRQVLADIALTGRIVAVIQGLADSVQDPQLAARLLVTLGRLLGLRTVNEAVKTSILLSAAPLTRLNGAVNDQLLSLVSSQFSCLEGKPARQALIGLFSLFAELDPEHFKWPAHWLVELHAWVEGRIAEPDFDRRLAAYAALKRAIDSGELHLDRFSLALVHCMVFGLRDIEELSIRNQSFAVLKSFVRTISISTSDAVSVAMADESAENETESDADANEDEADENISDASPSTDPVQFMVLNVLLPAVKKSIKSQNQVIRNEFISLLDLLVASFPTVQPFAALHAFNGGRLDDPEESIFYNLTHIQESRRCHAIRKIGELAAAGALTGLTRRTIEELLLPLTLATALPNSPEHVPSEAMQSDSIRASGQVLARLPWGAFARRVLDMTREISGDRKQECWKKAALRLLPAMISNFRVPDYDVAADFSVFSARIHDDLIPAMFGLLHQSSSGATEKDALKYSIRVPIAISIGHLIKLVSGDDLTAPSVQIHLPRLFAALLNILKAKEVAARQVARDALVKIVGFLGAAFLPFLLREGKTMLTRGYQRHVLVFTCHAILVELLRQLRKQVSEKDAIGAAAADDDAELDTLEISPVLSLNASAKLLVELALASCFGAQAKEREAAEWTGKQPEVRAAKGPEIIALTARCVDARVLHETVLEPIISLARLQLERVELNAVTGDGVQDSIDRVESEAFNAILRSLFGQNGLQAIATANPRRIPGIVAAVHEMLQMDAGSGTGTHIHLLHTAAFDFLCFVLNCRSGEEVDVFSLLDSFVPVAFAYLSSSSPASQSSMPTLSSVRHSAAINAAIGLFIRFISHRDRLPSLATVDMQKLLEEMFVSIIRSHSTAPAAYRLTATLIREWPDLTVTDSQLKMLLEYARINLETAQGQSLTFSLIRSLLSKGVVLLQLFELMRSVRAAMVTSHSPSTRQQCRSVYIQHLLHTPMATKKLEEELDFCLANLRYEFPAGRASVALLMEALAGRLPIQVVDQVAEAWFVALAAQLAKELTSTEGAEEAREAICAALKALTVRVQAGKRQENLSLLTRKWILASSKPAVQLAAWKICALRPELFLSEDVLGRGIEMIAKGGGEEDDLPFELLNAAIEALTVAQLDRESARKVALAASKAQYFAKDTDIHLRHRVALLWNCLLK